MIKSWSQFLREFVEPESFIDAKMQELKDLIDNITDKNIIWEWKNQNDHRLVVSFSTDNIALKYDFDIDDLALTKTAGDTVDFETPVESVEEGLELIESDIRSILGIYEGFSGRWESSLTEEDAKRVVERIIKFSKLEVMEGSDPEGIVDDLESELRNFDQETITLVVDTILFGEEDIRWKEWCMEEIIRVGDKIMSKYGTEPMQVLNAYDVAFRRLSQDWDWEDINEARKKSSRYKGKKIPGKYLTGPHPGKMKKEIDTFRGKDTYKKDWDADYTSGKGGKGSRVKTKKSAATKAYQRMFGKKEK